MWAWVLAALVLGAGCWAAPIVQELREDPGNLTMIVRTVEHRGSTLGASVGWHALARAVGERPWWLYVPASEWERKFDVRRSLTAAQRDSAIAVLAALALAGLAGALRRRWDLCSAAVIGLGMSAAIVAQVASNPASKLLSETLGYTLWWGSELGLWVWLVLSWALWLALCALARALSERLSLGRRMRAALLRFGLRRAQRVGPAAALARLRTALLARRRAAAARRAASSLLALAAIGGVAAVEPRSQRPRSPTRTSTSTSRSARSRGGSSGSCRRSAASTTGSARSTRARSRWSPRCASCWCVTAIAVLADGSYPRLGSYYELGDRPYQWIVYLRDGVRVQPHMTLAARVRFSDQWGTEVLSAWVQRAPARASGHARAQRRTLAR